MQEVWDVQASLREAMASLQDGWAVLSAVSEDVKVGLPPPCTPNPCGLACFQVAYP